MQPTLLTSDQWEDYELIDSGEYEKLERFGNYVIARPEPQALWKKSLPATAWKKADAVFLKEKKSDDRGRWERKPGMPEQWFIRYTYGDMRLTMRLGLTGFKHVGIFPEQAVNWNYIYDRIRSCGLPSPRVLNLFAYTGGASLAARSAGAEVTHVDSVRQVVTWSRENMEASGLDGIRWMVEDALRFVKREVKRGNRYYGIVLDPPAYGRGPDGEKWVLEDQIDELLTECSRLVDSSSYFIVLNLYSMGLSALLARTALRQLFGSEGTEEFGELYFDDRSGKSLPLGVYCRKYR